MNHEKFKLFIEELKQQALSPSEAWNNVSYVDKEGFANKKSLIELKTLIEIWNKYNQNMKLSLKVLEELKPVFEKVPENIEILKLGNDLLLRIGKKQVLSYSEACESWVVTPFLDSFEKASCVLKPCEFEDFKTGELGFYQYGLNSETGFLNNYFFVLAESGKVVLAPKEFGVEIRLKSFENCFYKFFKVVPE